MLSRNNSAKLLAAALLVTCSQAAMAMPILFIGSSGDLSASVLFDKVGDSLVVTLTNTSTEDVMAPEEILTAVFFEVRGPTLSLTPVSAVVGSGSNVLFGGTGPGNTVGGEWAFVGANFLPLGLKGYGISSSGLNYFGPQNLFPGDNLQGPDSPDGLQYGITSANDNPATGNQAVTGKNALIQNQVVFTLNGLPNGFDPATHIRNVYWQYGTSFDEPSYHTPEPVTGLVMGATTVLGGLIRGRRRTAVPA